MTWWLAILLKPVFAALFLLVLVAPVVWLLYRTIPNGKLKFTLFKVRDGVRATKHDKIVMSLAAIAAFAVLASFLIWLNTFAE